ncbi:hypothetical protein G4G28_06530 [Massilia sp. Dwa41.01b]|uniref:hypothetical protein n=1 Tax=unclassified Massilia TaxID=2609279 RepID=UPI00160053D8|nr:MULTISPECIES: hypothetical protein [unclassified Massilia]QNA88244.1 hypothetical protein G4G28_06530 [Massilia sp. Dwa41.01b]QNA99143.1 hypothetical protein G4G31_10250 [Massilia sp. Se16.2.3]
MDDAKRTELIRAAWGIHREVEASCLAHGATRGDAAWPEKQRLLLADMAIHLLQTALKPGPVELDELRKNLFSVLTISDGFLPEAGLKEVAEKLS